MRLFRTGALFLAAAAAAGQGPIAAGPKLQILAPTSYDIPVGETRIRVLPKDLQPGDTLDFFVDGRKIGSAQGPPWEAGWQVGETLTRHTVVVVVLRGGREVARAQVTTTLQEGQLFMPMHYCETNQLTLAVFDPYSRQPSIKSVPPTSQRFRDSICTSAKKNPGLFRSISRKAESPNGLCLRPEWDFPDWKETGIITPSITGHNRRFPYRTPRCWRNCAMKDIA